MELSPDQQKALEEQKKQCPFCKLASGEYPSSTIYEDNYLRAVLDIRPSKEGHVLVIPKEHYPILAFMQEEEFDHTFKVAQDIAKVFKKSLLSFGTNIFVANGGVAGQQVPHFAFHLIPRDDENELECFNVPANKLDSAEYKKAFDVISHNLTIAMKKRYDKFPLEQPKAEPVEQPQTKQPVQDAKPKTEPVEQPEVEVIEPKAPTPPKQEDVQSALMLTDQELENLLNMKESLKNLLLDDTDTLHKLASSNERLQRFFEGTTIEDVAKRAKRIFKSDKGDSLEDSL